MTVWQKIRHGIDRLLHPGARFYAHILSLGYNCENSFRFFHAFGFVESSLFAWTGWTDSGQLLAALRSVGTLGTQSYEFLKDRLMWRDVAFGIVFHGRAPMSRWRSGEYGEEEMDADREELTSRVEHLKQKFSSVLKDGGRTLFMVKWSPNETLDPVRVRELRSTLVNICANPFDLVLVVRSDMLEGVSAEDFGEGVEPLVLARYPHDAHVTDLSQGDNEAWARFWNFHRPITRERKRKKFKFEAV